MISSLTLTDFKSFTKGTIPFSRITVITGPNSSGKTVVLSALAALIQSRAPHAFPFDFVANGPNCSLGSFGDVLRRGKGVTRFTISVDFESIAGKKSSLSTTLERSHNHEEIVASSISYKGSQEERLEVERNADGQFRAQFANPAFFRMLENERVFDAFSQFIATLQKNLRPSEPRKKESRTVNIDQPDFEDLHSLLASRSATTRRWTLLAGTSMQEALVELSKNPVAQTVIADVERQVLALQDSTSYVGPVRAHPARYYFTKDSQLRVDPMGETAFAQLLDWTRHSPRRVAEVVTALRLLGLATKLEARAVLGDIVKVSVGPHSPGRAFSIADVGFGISQMLPVIVADVALPPRGTLLVNQPEVHLHPSSQAQVADYMLSRPATRQYIVETHSEYLLNRLRLRVADGSLAPEDVTVVYIDPPTRSRPSPRVVRVMLNRDGSLGRAPKSFFKTYYEDSFQIASAVLKED